MSPTLSEAFVAHVQRNCHVADARHAADMTLCTYLLQMREFFRWEQGLALQMPLARAAVGAWMAEREALWAEVADEGYAALPLPGGGSADPFDVDAVNAALAPLSLLYGAGLVARERPVFFVADLHGRAQREGVAVLQAGRERARTLLAPPAALGGGGAGPIVLRRESMARWCWERAEAYAMRPRPGGALHAMLAHYGLERDFQAGLPRWLDDQCETAVWHELGEYRLSKRWRARWTDLRAALDGSADGLATDPAREGAHGPAREAAHGETRAATLGDARAAARGDAREAARGDALVRALRDQLADLGVTLPALLERGDAGPMHAWFAAYEGLREAMFPALSAAYAAWRGGDGGALLKVQMAHGLRHFEALAADLLEGPAAARAAARTRLMQSAPGTGVPPSIICRWPPGS